MLKTYKDKMQMRAMVKNPINYENIRKETNIYEQNPTKIDDFNDAEEAEAKEHVQKRKEKQKNVAEKNKLLKKNKNLKKTKKKEMWERLSELNGEFKNIKKAKKEAKKMSGTIIN